jgi:hypothetical protein
MLEKEPNNKLMNPCLAAYGIDDITDLSGSASEVLVRKAKMDGIYNDIIKYKEANNEPLGRSLWVKGVITDSVEVRKPCKSEDTFYRIAAKTGWIDELLEKCIDPTNEDDDAICCLIDYLLRHHEDKTRDELSKAGVIPSILDSFEVAALMNRTTLGVAQWQLVVQCLKRHSKA